MISPGTKLGTYEITSHIGSGGMGEVYEAHDSKLGRDVAIKVLPERFSRDPERLARFQREAKLLASLNHPNIATIHGLEESSDTHYLVMELVPGETLAQRIKRDGALPVEEALTIARQMAEALEAAHGSEKAIIHRDLKPANVKVTPEGRVKVLDFGLAKAFSNETASDDPSNSSTLSALPTQQGMIMGTAAYMSPEQARGKAVTKATDIFAFGAVLYELLTGKQAFQGDDISDILAAVIRAEPEWGRLPADTPPAIRTLLRRCLRKDRQQRLGDAGAVRIEIQDVLSGAITAEPIATVTVAAPRPPLWRRAMPVAIAACLAAALAGGGVWLLTRPAPEAAPISRFDYDFPQEQQFRNFNRGVMALSPDGSRFIYNTVEGLYLRSMDQLEARMIPGTEAGLSNPFFSPDGQWVGYWQNGQLKKIAISGGAPLTICPATNPLGVSWAPDNTILFAEQGIWRVSANGGAPELLIEREPGEIFDGAQLLPGGEWILFSIAATTSAWDEARIVIQSTRSRQRREIWRGGSDARYVPTGHIVYALGDDLFAIPFDLGTLTVAGGPVPLVEGVLRATISASANYGISDGGSLVYVSGSGPIAQRTLVWVDRQGREEAIQAPPRAYVYTRLSPDGTRVALDIRDQENDVWIWDLARETLARLTFDPGFNRLPVWTPDGKRVAFSAQRGSAENIYWQAADGSGAPEPLTDIPSGSIAPHAFSPDGTLLLFTETADPRNISLLKLAGERKPEPLLQTSYNEATPQISPDGRWLAYESNESGRAEVFVRPFPDVNAGRWQISTGGGTRPSWNSNGRELFYYIVPGTLMAVRIEPGSNFQAGSPVVVFEGAYPAPLAGRQYSVSPDGRRFLMIKNAAPGANAPPPQIIVVQNWFEELKRRVPAGQK
jgi:serine/threonine-protein kinase